MQTCGTFQSQTASSTSKMLTRPATTMAASALLGSFSNTGVRNNKPAMLTATRHYRHEEATTWFAGCEPGCMHAAADRFRAVTNEDYPTQHTDCSSSLRSQTTHCSHDPTIFPARHQSILLESSTEVDLRRPRRVRGSHMRPRWLRSARVREES